MTYDGELEPLMPTFEGSRDEKQVQQYSAGSAYVFAVNYMFGSGILALPFAFSDSSLLVGVVTLIIVAFCCTLTALWILEIVSRAHALRRSKIEDDKSANGQVLSPPNYDLPSFNMMKYPDMVGYFLGPSGFRIYLTTALVYLISALWSYSSVVASSLTGDIPIPGISAGFDCDNVCANFPKRCSLAYLIYLGAHLVIAMVLSLKSLKDQAFVQMLFTVLRYAISGLMVIVVLYGMYVYPYDPKYAGTSKPFLAEQMYWNPSLKGLSMVIPACVFSQIVHHSIPMIAEPVIDKSKLKKAIIACFSTICVIYMAVCVACVLFFGKDVNAMVSLNWEFWDGKHWLIYNSGKRPWFISVIVHLIIIYPAASCLSSFPLNAITLSANVMDGFSAETRKRMEKGSGLTIIKIMSVMFPVFIAGGVKCLSTIVRVCGLAGYLITFFFPAFLQIISRKECIERFGPVSGHKTPFSIGILSRPFFPIIVLVFGLFSFLITVYGIVQEI